MKCQKSWLCYIIFLYFSRHLEGLNFIAQERPFQDSNEAEPCAHLDGFDGNHAPKAQSSLLIGDGKNRLGHSGSPLVIPLKDIKRTIVI